MKKKVITIGRQYGSNGRMVGQVLADRLGVHFYDKDILKLAQEHCGIPYDELVKVDERAASKWRYPVEENYQMQGRYRYEPMNDLLFETESRMIKKLAEEEACVIVGRCSNMLLKDREDSLSVFVYAPFEERVKTVMERSDIAQREAEILVKRIDKERGYYYNYHTDKRWDDMSQYDLCVNSGELTVEEIVDMIQKVVEE